MNLPKLLAVTVILLFGSIAFVSFFRAKKNIESESHHPTTQSIELGRETRVVNEPPVVPVVIVQQVEKPKVISLDATVLPEANRIDELFNLYGSQLPIVETVTYKSRVNWLKGRPAWLSDYASHFHTSRHFIARSLNKKRDYFKQDVAEGDRFNVFKEDLPLEFHLVVDLSKAKLWFYYHDLNSDERVLLKTYAVGLGRTDPSTSSGFLSPVGKYKLGDKIAIYEPNKMGYHQGQKTELIRIFGTRWIPFEQELEGCSAPAKGLGLHGLPWAANEQGELVELRGSLGKYESDGCIRLATEDIEEIFAIVVTKPTVIELVKDFAEAKLPGKNLSQ